jgi:tRNA 5-methylaminomethyl-2-thiouridine biosynthesis bifunctional protein
MLSIQPAKLAFDASGTPCSREFGDVYHNAASGPGQARHVFLGGNDLPARWAGARGFVILETGFGLGLNFLATWKAWRNDPRRCARQHFVSIERHPFAAADLATAHALYPEFADLARQMGDAWPVLVPGLHRLHFEQGAVSLTLVFGDAANAARELRLAADAFYLDGFAPERNPDMWSTQLLRSLARLAAPGSTLATWSVARAVRDAVAAAGFVAERRPGFGGKREMLVARYAPRWPTSNAMPRPEWPERRAMVIGAGLAGAAVASRLVARGWVIDLVERADVPGSAASGLFAGAVQPHVSRDDCLLSRFTRAGFLHAQRARAPDTAGEHRWECGVLQLSQDAADEARVATTAAALEYPPEYAACVTRATASELAGAEVQAGGWWFPRAGWVQPGALVRADLAGAGAQVVTHYGCEVVRLSRVGERWCAIDADGTKIAAAPVVVLANAFDASRLMDLGPHSLRTVRGQQSHLPTPPFIAPRAIVSGDGYVFPSIDGIAVAGATYDQDSVAPQPDAIGHAANLARVERLLPGSAGKLAAAALDGRVGFRCIATDRMPMIGVLADVASAMAQAQELTGARLRELPRLSGLYGAFAFASRGLTWTPLAAELLASQIDGEPLPLEGALVDAIDPARFIMRRLRRGSA